jgi:hypothetical protein
MYEAALPVADPSRVVEQVSLEGRDFVFEFSRLGTPMKFFVAGEIVTGNTFLLLPLFLASPIRRCWKAYVLFLSGGLVGAIAIHLYTMGCFVQHALQRLPEVRSQTGSLSSWVVETYLHYSYIGLYVLIFATWFPYMGYFMMRTRKHGASSGIPVVT